MNLPSSMYEPVAYSPVTVIAAAIGDADTTITVDDGSLLGDAPNIAVIGSSADKSETIIYGTKNGNILSDIQRGVQGTAQSWTIGDPISRNFTALDQSNIQKNILALNIGKANIDDVMLKGKTISSGDISQIIGMPSGAYRITNTVTGMAQAGFNWWAVWVVTDMPGMGLLIASQYGGMGNVTYNLAINNIFQTWDRFDTALTTIPWSRLTGVPDNVINAVNRSGDQISGKLTVVAPTTSISANASAGEIELITNNGLASGITLHRPGIYAANFGLDTDNQLKIGGYSMGNIAYVIIHSGNLVAQLAALPTI